MFSDIIAICCWPKKKCIHVLYPLFIYKFILSCPMVCCLLLYHIHVFLYYKFLLMHRGCLSMQHAWLLTPRISWEGTLLPTACCGNDVLYIMYIILCFMVICSYSIALYSSITPAFSCTEPINSQMIDVIPCLWLVWMCIRVKCSNTCGGYSCTWLFKYYHDFICFIITICS